LFAVTVPFRVALDLPRFVTAIVATEGAVATGILMVYSAEAGALCE
jgi:hypothetical protein